MPNKKSAEKRVLTTERNRQRNKAVKSETRTAIKKVRELLDEAKPELKTAVAALQHAQSLLDRAVVKGILSKNKASRDKSRLMLALKKTQASR